MNSQLELLRQRWLSSVCSRRVSLGNRGPIVSFTFDDFPRSALTIGGRILKGYGVRGTYYAAMGLMNTSNESGEQFHREDLDALLGDGHELASHTFSHVSCRLVSCSAFRREVEKGRRAIRELTGRSDSGNFAFPFGDVTLNAKRKVGRDVTSCRSIWNGLNGPEIDLNLLRADLLFGDQEKFGSIRELILDNQRRKSWLIFYSHDVQHAPSRFGCHPALLESAVEFAVRLNARILTITEVMAELLTCPQDQAGAAKATQTPTIVSRGLVGETK
jgi:peptidoglycan/xylan/chitin deacetylase (PgdA/CDA1 family)